MNSGQHNRAQSISTSPVLDYARPPGRSRHRFLIIQITYVLVVWLGTVLANGVPLVLFVEDWPAVSFNSASPVLLEFAASLLWSVLLPVAVAVHLGHRHSAGRLVRVYSIGKLCLAGVVAIIGIINVAIGEFAGLMLVLLAFLSGVIAWSLGPRGYGIFASSAPQD